MTLGYVLINAEAGKERAIRDAIVGRRGIREVHVLYGEYDIIVALEAEDATKLAKMVVGSIRYLDGVKQTRTHIAIQ